MLQHDFSYWGSEILSRMSTTSQWEVVVFFVWNKCTNHVRLFPFVVCVFEACSFSCVFMYFYVQLLSISSEGCLLVYSFELLLIQHFAAGVTEQLRWMPGQLCLDLPPRGNTWFICTVSSAYINMISDDTQARNASTLPQRVVMTSTVLAVSHREMTRVTFLE